MKAPECGSPGCPRPVPDNGYICTQCGDALAADLEQIAAQWPALHDVLAKQTRFTRGRIGGRPAPSGETTPIPFDDSMREPAGIVGNTITTWARDIAATRGLDLAEIILTRPAVIHGPACPAADACAHGPCRQIRDLRAGRVEPALSQAARFIADGIGFIRHWPQAVELCDEIGHAAMLLRRAVDAPPDMISLGECGAQGRVHWDCECGCHLDPDEACPFACGYDVVCGGQLRAERGKAGLVRCRECGAKHDIGRRIRAQIEASRGRLATATEIARFASERSAGGTEAMPFKRLRDRIYTWAKRSRILARGHTDAGDPTYLIGEVLDLLTDDDRAAQTSRLAKRSA